MTEIEKRLSEIKKELELDGSVGTEDFHLGNIGWLITQLEASLKREAALVEALEKISGERFCEPHLGKATCISSNPSQNCGKIAEKALTQFRESLKKEYE